MSGEEFSLLVGYEGKVDPFTNSYLCSPRGEPHRYESVEQALGVAQSATAMGIGHVYALETGNIVFIPCNRIQWMKAFRHKKATGNV